MTYCDLLIFGATRNTGFLIAQEAKASGFSVASMVRATSDKNALMSLGVELIDGDAFNLNDCKKAFAQTTPKWVVSVLGGKNASGRRVDAEGNLNVIEAATECSSISRFLLMTSMGCGDQYEASSEQVKKFLGDALRVKTQAENALQESRLPWSILRPGGLNHSPATGNYQLLDTPDRSCEGYLSRGDVALATLQVLEQVQWLKRIITVQSNARKKDNEHED